MRLLELLVVCALYKCFCSGDATTAGPRVDASNVNPQPNGQQLEQRSDDCAFPSPSPRKLPDNSLDGARSQGCRKKTSKGKKTYICESCGKDCKSRTQLNRHLRVHTGERPYTCDKCSKAFSQKSNLNQHMSTHTGEKPHSCDHCSKAFSRKGLLKIHMRTHTGEEPYPCKFCSKSFRIKCNLKTHIRTHTGEKPFSCKICSKAFSVISNLNRHTKTHSDTKPHSSKDRHVGKSNLQDTATDASCEATKGDSAETQGVQQPKEEPLSHEIADVTLDLVGCLPKEEKIECCKASETSPGPSMTQDDASCEPTRDNSIETQRVQQPEEEPMRLDRADETSDSEYFQVAMGSARYCDVYGRPPSTSGTQNYASSEAMRNDLVETQGAYHLKEEPRSPEIADVLDFGGWIPKKEEIEFCETSEMSRGLPMIQYERARDAESNSTLRAVLSTMTTDECNLIEIKDEFKAIIKKEMSPDEHRSEEK